LLRLADIVRRHGALYLERHRAAMLPSHVRALFAIERCRTPALGAQLGLCAQCGRHHLLYHSCGHRACPRCGYAATTRWLEGQRALLLPVPYFHVVFTLPAELRRLVRSHQKRLLPIVFGAAYDALAALCRLDRYLGGRIGALAVLHTWTRTLEYHPHVHMLIPGGALAPDSCTWRAAPQRRKSFLVPVAALAKGFRGRFLARARRALPDDVELPFVANDKHWVVFAKPAVQGAEHVLRYLGRYVHRTAISDRALLNDDHERVTFAYRDSRDHQPKRMSLPPHEFLRRFLQHVLPKGLHRVRAFGLLHPAHRLTLRRLQLALAKREPPERPRHPRPRLRCPHCHTGKLVLRRRLRPSECLALLNASISTPARSNPARAPPP
jgi:hypothetical protein